MPTINTRYDPDGNVEGAFRRQVRDLLDLDIFTRNAQIFDEIRRLKQLERNQRTPIRLVDSQWTDDSFDLTLEVVLRRPDGTAVLDARFNPRSPVEFACQPTPIVLAGGTALAGFTWTPRVIDVRHQDTKP